MGLLDYFHFRNEGTGSSRVTDAVQKGWNKFKGAAQAPFKWLGRKATDARMKGEGGRIAEAASREQSRFFPNDFHDQVEAANPVMVTSLGKNGRTPVYS
jgi:hypothetical protein